MTKSVAYSYPTSPNADHFGFPHGCWTVELCEGIKPPMALAAFKFQAEAIDYANRLPQAWNWAYLECQRMESERVKL